eukprot:305881_1
MAAIDFKKLMAQELAKAKAKAFSNANSTQIKSDSNDNNDLKQFMHTRLNLDESFATFNPSIHHLPNTKSAYYIPNFLSKESEKHVLSLIYSAPKSCWIRLKRRTLQCWGGKADPNNLNKFNIETLPVWGQDLCDKVTDSNLYTLNCNEPN